VPAQAPAGGNNRPPQQQQNYHHQNAGGHNNNHDNIYEASSGTGGAAATAAAKAKARRCQINWDREAQGCLRQKRLANAHKAHVDAALLERNWQARVQDENTYVLDIFERDADDDESALDRALRLGNPVARQAARRVRHKRRNRRQIQRIECKAEQHSAEERCRQCECQRNKRRETRENAEREIYTRYH
jgi:hypothetical protein